MRSIFAVMVFALVFAESAAHAQDFGVVMDISGKAALAGKKGALDLGKNIVVGDVISLKEKASVTVVSYQGCEEWRIGGPASVKFTAQKPETEKGSKGTVTKGRKLPVCYKPADAQASGSHEQGGLVLMNKAVPQDQMEGPAPVEMSGTVENEEITRMRQAFSGGKADNAALMTLVMHDLQRRDMESVRPYYAELKKRAPDSAFVKRIGKEFNL